MIHWLDDLAPDAIARVGGKAAPLAALAAEGLPVPPGFVVDTTAYEALVESQPALGRAFEAARAHPAEAVASALVPAIQGATLPTDVVVAVIDAYAELAKRLDVTDPPVAVRSSAVGEDGAGASFAGQQATYLHVCGASSVVAALRACWSGLWSERAVAYRRRLGDESPPAIAVLVQAMVVPEVAGVAFSVHPVTGARDEVVIDASWGLGEAVVSGRVTPDHVIVDKASGAVTSYMVGEKEIEVVADGTAGVTARDVEPDRRKRRALSDDQVRALAALASDIETRRGAPQDLEWAYAGGAFYVLQARPITGLPPAPPAGGWAGPTPGAQLERRNFAEHLPGPLSPLAETLVLPAVAATLPELAREVGMRLPQPSLVVVQGYAYARVDMRPGWDIAFRAAVTAAETIGRDPRRWERSPGGGHAARMRLLLEHPPEPGDAVGHVAWTEAFVEQFAVTWRDLHRLSGGWRWTEYVLRRALGGQILAAGALLQGFDSPAFDLERRLHAAGRHTYVLDGDNMRHGLNRDLGFTEADRVENIRRVSEVARLMVDAGLIVIVSAISPYRSEREAARARFAPGVFVEVHVSTPLEVCAERDSKGLYAKAHRGELTGFTGVDAPYEAPEHPELALSTADLAIDACVERILAALPAQQA
ncbi:MAG: adenylyl-sulfate kinase [Candidatus Sericytochromatia bacterium]